jgi:hypothetical protein
MSSLATLQPHNCVQPRQLSTKSHSGLKKTLALAFLMLTLLLVHSANTLAEPSIPNEYSVKAALIYSIIKFVDWPEQDKQITNNPLCIAVFGQDPFGSNIDMISSKTAKGRPIKIRRLQKIEEIRSCEVLFISSSEKLQLARIMKQLQNQPILTIADHGGFPQAGGMINLTTVNNKVQFEINNNAALRSRLRISSQLLKLAKIVIE